MSLPRPQNLATSALPLVALLLIASPAFAQELAPDWEDEARYFEAVMQSTYDTNWHEAVDTERSPQLDEPESTQDSSPAGATRYGIAPVAPPLELPFEIDSDLELPFGMESLSDDQILGYIAYYCTDGRRQLNHWIAKSGRYEEIILAEAERQGAPRDVLWVVAVESAFDPLAVSHAGAVGLWQFMPRTGSYLGMRIDSYVDDRQDPFVSTAYGINYLRQLEAMFESWPLALAAYNAGLGHVRSELRRANATDFSKLDEYQAIYANARNYAGRIIAIATIMRNAEHFGFASVVKDDPMSWDEVRVDERTTLARVASRAGVDVEEIVALNPRFRRRATPPDESVIVRLPAGSFRHYVDSIENFDENAVRHEPLRFGETIDMMGERFGVSGQFLRALNRFGSRERIPYGTMIALPEDASERPTASGERAVAILPETRFSYDDRVRVFYELKPGDSLREVASHFQVDPYLLAGWNDLDPEAYLWSGIILQIYVPDDIELVETVYLTEGEVQPLVLGSPEYWEYRRADRQESERRVRRHTVRSGDTLSGIAARYDVSVQDLMRWNDLDDDGRILIGQTLRVR